MEELANEIIEAVNGNNSPYAKDNEDVSVKFEIADGVNMVVVKLSERQLAARVERSDIDFDWALIKPEDLWDYITEKSQDEIDLMAEKNKE